MIAEFIGIKPEHTVATGSADGDTAIPCSLSIARLCDNTLRLRSVLAHL
jgi:hypothetical protein